jgi:hypothetical protein
MKSKLRTLVKIIFLPLRIIFQIKVAVWLIVVLLLVILANQTGLVHLNIRISNKSESNGSDVTRTEREATESAKGPSLWIKGSSTKITPTSMQEQTAWNTNEQTVTCVIDPNCGGGERIMPLSRCENSACCLENGDYVQYWDRKYCEGKEPQSFPNTNNQAPVVYEFPTYVIETPKIDVPPIYLSIYVQSYQTAYDCLPEGHDEIRLADAIYVQKMEDTVRDCASDIVSVYSQCLDVYCPQYELLEDCFAFCEEFSDKDCPSQVGSPEYNDLENAMIKYCQ